MFNDVLFRREFKASVKLLRKVSGAYSCDLGKLIDVQVSGGEVFLNEFHGGFYPQIMRRGHIIRLLVVLQDAQDLVKKALRFRDHIARFCQKYLFQVVENIEKFVEIAFKREGGGNQAVVFRKEIDDDAVRDHRSINFVGNTLRQKQKRFGFDAYFFVRKGICRFAVDKVSKAV